MLLFLLGIAFDETLRRLVLPWIRRHPEHVPVLRGLLAGAFEPASRDGMYYMSGNLTDTFHAAAAAEADRQAKNAATSLVRSFVDDLTSGCLGPIDPGARAAIDRHLRGARIRSELAGFHIPGLNAIRRVATDYNPVYRMNAYVAKKAWKHLNRPYGSSSSASQPGGAAPDDGGQSAPPPDDGGDQPPTDDSQGALMEPNKQTILDMVDEHGDVPATLLVGAALNMSPKDRASLWGELEERRRRHHGHHGHHHHHRHPGGDVTGWGLSSLFHSTKKVASSPAGTLLVSATPGGVSAIAAKSIASKALKSGQLKPAHLKAAGDLAKRGRAGDQGALVKIAKLKQAAGRGDKNAELALDRVKLAHCIQTGKVCTPASRGTSFRTTYARGAGLMRLHPSH